MDVVLEKLENNLKQDKYNLKKRGLYNVELSKSIENLFKSIDEYKNLEEKEIMNKN